MNERTNQQAQDNVDVVVAVPQARNVRPPMILSALLLAAAGAGPHAQSTPARPTGAAAVSHERLAQADREPGAWMATGGSYLGQHYSPLDQINDKNVSELGLAWYADIDTERGQESTPIIVDGVMYVTTAWSMVKAFDIKTGAKLWVWAFHSTGQHQWRNDSGSRTRASHRKSLFIADLQQIDVGSGQTFHDSILIAAREIQAGAILQLL